MSKTVGDFFVERLYDWGVRTIFGYPGDGINGVLGALQRSKKKIEFIQVRHEEMAAFMASAHAKFTGQPGVCLSTGGPGASHMVTGLYDAKMDHMPVLAICGQAPRTARGAHYTQELNLDRLFQDVADYVYEAEAPSQVRHLVDRAMRTVLGRNGIGVLILPGDLQELPYEEPPRKHGSVQSGIGYAKPRVVPHDIDLRRAAEVLNAGKKVAILVGAGALHATDEVIAVADRLQAGAAKALLGKAALPDDLPWVTGSIGILGTKASWELMTHCDTLLMIGSGFPYAEFLPEEGKARAVQIDIDPTMLSIRYPAEVNLHGDSAETLRLLLPLLEQKSGDWRRQVESEVQDSWKLLENRALVRANPINPQRVAWELSPQLPVDAIVTSDSGSCANWYARDLRVRRGQMYSLSGGLASMGAAVPYAIAAKFAHSERPVIAMVGDGAMQMNNMAELITVSKYWRLWKDPRWIVCVFNNGDLNQVTWEQRVMEGDPKFEATQKIPDVPYHKFGELIGLKGIYCDNPEEVAIAWREALAADRPVVLEFKTDPEVPPLPSHITLEQAKSFMETVVKGDPKEGSMLAGVARQVLSGILPKDKS
ncbi:thiamine pyrophosphate-binding protein [Massilia sp. WF1]|uniref:thiamine pyrophosphate-requiring protein n=1 Tax=unclassified Massilia TaxID=2609279 RepID=UPI00064A886D|nr:MULTISPECIES: thiamine pyrophosphate-requiring protein [unclassified Massilia]ALK96594.1 thiamine pyrophosphate-binding protein [Massilia sp. WG5]KLU36237.1 thiamine pyrophosphate-binding protein [Massilia sp. WF1]